MEKLKGNKPNMDTHDKVDDQQLEAAMSEYMEGMDKGDLEAELQVLFADRSPIDDIEVLFFIAQNSLEVTSNESIKGQVEAGYEFVLTYAGDDYHTLLSRIPNLEDYLHT